MHFRVERSPEATEAILVDWIRLFADFDDECVRLGADACIVDATFFPATSTMLNAVQLEARIALRRSQEVEPLPVLPRNDEPLGDAHFWADLARQMRADPTIEMPEIEPLWSPCSECDGSHFVEVDRRVNSVRPCSTCNRRAYDLWAGGHYRPNHRCETCMPTRRHRVGE